MRVSRLVVVVSLFGWFVACGGGDSTGPSGSRATAVAAQAGDNQQATVASAVPVPPAVLVTDRSGAPVKGVTVTFTVQAGGGSIAGGTTTSDVNGVATVGGWTLGTVAGANQLRATVSGLAPVTFTATGTAGVPSLLSLATAPSGTVANGAALATQPAVQLKDQYGNNSPQAGVTIVASIDSGGGTLTGQTQVATDATGKVSFTGLTITGIVGGRKLGFGATGLTGVRSGVITVTAGVATSLGGSGPTSLSGTVGAPVNPAPAVLVTDQSGNAVTGLAVTFAVTGGGGSVTGPVAVSNASGIATVGSWTLGNQAGTNTMTATVVGLPVVTFTATGTAAAPTRLAIVQQPGGTSAASGQLLSPQPTVKLQDGFGNNVSLAGVTVTATISTGGGTLGGTAAVQTSGAGLAAYTDLVITGLVGSRNLRFDATLNGAPLTPAVSASFSLAAGAAAQIAPSAGTNQTAAAGTTLPVAPAVLVTDGAGNPVSGVAVTFAVASGGGSLTGGSPSSGQSGIAQVGSWTLGTVAGPNTMTATAAGLNGSPLTFTATGIAGPVASAVVNGGNNQSVTVGTAVPTAPSVLVRDAFNNPVAGVSVAFAVTGGGGAVTGGGQTTGANGIATVGSWTLGTAAGPNGLSATITGVAPVNFTATGTSGPATGLAFATAPAAAGQSGVPLAIQPEVQVVDQYGNGVAQGGALVTATLASGTGSLTNATATTSGAGLASFSGLTITGLAGAYTIAFNASGLPTLTSGQIAISSGVAVALAVNQPPGNGQSGVVLPTQPSIQIIDASLNPVNQNGVLVTATITGGPGGATLTGASATTGPNGLAVFSGLTITGPVGSYTLQFSATGLTPVSPPALSITAGPAATVAVNAGNNQSATVGTAVAVAPSVLVSDGFGNPVPGVTVTFAVTAGGGSVTGATPATNGSGIAAVGSWTLGTTAGVNTLMASVAGASSATFDATGTAGPAAVILIEAGDGQSATVGAAVTVAPAVRVTDVSGNPVSGVAVTFSVTGGGGLITGATPSTNASGVATLGSWTLGTTAGANTLSATASVGSVDFTATGLAGPATTLAATQGDGQSATVNTAVAIPPEVAATDAFGNPVANVPVAFAVAGGGGGVTGASPVTGSNGRAAVGSWTLGTIAGANSLTATSGSLTGSPVTFNATGTPGAASQLEIVTQPGQGGATVGQVFPVQPVVRRLDGFGNLVLSPTASITASVASGGGTLGGTASITTNASTGLATWTDLQMTGTAGTKSLKFTTGALSVTSQPFNLAAGPVASLSITTQPSSSVLTGNVLAQQPVVQLLDNGGNPSPVAGVNVTAAITGSPAGISLTGTVTVATNASGVASFTNLGFTGLAGSYSLTFSAASYVGVSSGAIQVNPGGAASIVAASTTSQAGRVGAPVSDLPSVIVKDASGNPVPGATVTFAVSGGGGTVSGGSQSTDQLGVATVGGWVLGKLVGPNQVTATTGALAPVNFDATAAFVAKVTAAGGAHSCLITVDDVPYCWGSNSNGGLGDGTITQRVKPTPVTTSETYTSLAAGRGYTCGLVAGGLARCWGLNSKGQLGIGSFSDVHVPTAVSGGLSYSLITASAASGEPHSCGILGGGLLYCWGSNLYSQFGDGGSAIVVRNVPGPGPAALTFTSAEAGVFYTCGVRTTGEGDCWGLNQFGQLGDGTKTLRQSPTTVLGGLLFTDIVTSQIHSCGITQGGSVYCWGDNLSGRLGQDTLVVTQSLTPLQVNGLGGVVELTAGLGHTCARTSGGMVTCWGLNDLGQVGDGTTTNRIAATPVILPSGITGFTSLGSGDSHTCAVANTGAAYCWGANGSGTLGNGGNTDSSLPVQVLDP